MTRQVRPVALRTCNLAVGYRRRHAIYAVIERVSVTIRQGELVCLLGANGVGKTTLLRTIAAMQPPLSGRVEIGNDDAHAAGAAELAKILAIVLTDRAAIAGLTSRRVVELGRYPHTGWFGRLDQADRLIVDAALDAVGIRHLANRDISQLSDGERQRVMIARALAQQPSVLILDEPTAFLDLPSRVELMMLLRDLTRREGVAVIVSSHDLELAVRVADVIWLLVPGGELATGAPEDVMLSGAIADAFEGSRVRFDVADRAFRLLTGARGHALVRGSGVRASLAASVLEREGYTTRGSSESAIVTVTVDEAGWQAVIHNQTSHGADFASLAASLRQRSATL
jgi:iron complex transport system ATP-binding protein